MVWDEGDPLFNPFFQGGLKGPGHVHVNCPQKIPEGDLYHMSVLRGLRRRSQITGLAFVRPLC
jgi:hypothetical protein